MEEDQTLLEQPVGQKVIMRVSREGGLEELIQELRTTNFVLCNAPARIRIDDDLGEITIDVSMNFGVERRVHFSLGFDIPIPPAMVQKEVKDEKDPGSTPVPDGM